MSMLLDIVAPIRCVACGVTSDGDLCAPCADDVVALTDPLCARCGGRAGCGCDSLVGFGRARSVVAFAEPARSLTLALKRRARSGAVDVVAGLIADRARTDGLLTVSTVVTYVPSGRSAARNGFDHARVLAAATARRLGRPLASVLRRTSQGPRQADVSLERRRTNVAGRFTSRPTAGHILLVDDVYTTGATAEACAIALRQAGAASVDVVTWARTLRRDARRRAASPSEKSR